jgi:hypothetical protein
MAAHRMPGFGFLLKRFHRELIDLRDMMCAVRGEEADHGTLRQVWICTTQKCSDLVGVGRDGLYRFVLAGLGL